MAGTIIVGMQWGDEGKAKVLDSLLESGKYSAVARYQGGANAGHTIWHDGKKHVCHLIPSGILHPKVTNVMGNGMAVHVPTLLNEIEEAEAAGGDPQKRLLISSRATVILDYHIRKDRAEGGAIGTTGRGIGPAYVSVADRSAVKMEDILDDTSLRAALRRFRKKNPDADTRKDWQELRAARQSLAGMIQDTSAYLNEVNRKGKNVLLEGAQATMLDKDHGTFPFVTSSNPTAGGACTGTGMGPTTIESVIGIMKAYVTRVGCGPFPTEMGGKRSDRHCAQESHVLRYELERFGVPFTLDDKGRPVYDPHDPRILTMLVAPRSDENLFRMGIALRLAGGEYGATTGRPRRCGWQDLVVARHAIDVNGIDAIAMTKIDVLDDCDEILVATSYRDPLTRKIHRSMPSRAVFERVTPDYDVVSYRPMVAKVAGCTSWAELPDRAKRYVEFLERKLDRPIKYVSTGADRSCMIVR